MNPIIKLLLSALLVFAASEVSKRNNVLGAILISLPILSIITILIKFFDGESAEKIAEFSSLTLWFVLPSLVFFIIFPILIRYGINFYLSLTAAIIATFAAYKLTADLLSRYLNINI